MMQEPAAALQNLLKITASWPWPASSLQSALCSRKLVRSTQKTFHISGNESSKVDLPNFDTKLVGVVLGLWAACWEEEKSATFLTEKKLDLSTFAANTLWVAKYSEDKWLNCQLGMKTCCGQQRPAVCPGGSHARLREGLMCIMMSTHQSNTHTHHLYSTVSSKKPPWTDGRFMEIVKPHFPDDHLLMLYCE